MDSDFVSFLDKYIYENLNLVLDLCNENALIHGRKTLKKEDVEYAINQLSEKKDSWEI